MKKVTAFILLLVIVLAACSPTALPEPTATPIPPTVIRPTAAPTKPLGPADTPMPDPLSSGIGVDVDVNGHSMTIHCFGTGSPVVVLESGAGAVWTYWHSVFTSIPRDIRVCTYDRSPQSHTSQEYVEDLHALLAGAGLDGPYVLVGHSYGGLNVILYADRYPEEVAGIVLEDSSHPDLDARILAVLPTESPNDSADLKSWREFVSTPQHAVFKTIDWTTSCEQVRPIKSLGDIPLIVLTAAAPDQDFGNIPADLQAKLDQADQDTQKEFTSLSSNSKQIIATTNNHMVHTVQPQLVIDAILELVKAARGQ
jgi:pimeloyl-ACP methyl ester carboxylesterase